MLNASHLPKLDFEAGIPDECRPPSSYRPGRPWIDARPQLERLELHYLANPDPTTQFVLLSVSRMRRGIAVGRGDRGGALAEVRRLNHKYPSKPFHVLHRPRRFNAAEGVWMAWERKRGKLEEFNRLLAGDPATSFTLHEGDPRISTPSATSSRSMPTRSSRAGRWRALSGRWRTR
jgi:cyclic beta-1,2-glucan synthetase